MAPWPGVWRGESRYASLGYEISPPLPQYLRRHFHTFFHHIFHISPFYLSTSVLSRSALLENCTMPKQVTTKRKVEDPNHRSKAMPTKKLKKASCQSALNSPPRPASATDSSCSDTDSPLSDTDSSLSESFPPSLTSGFSIEDSSSSTANSLVDKSSASTASIEKSSSAPPATRASSTSILQETRPDHGGAKESSWVKFRTMSREELKEYGRLRGWRDRTWSAPHF